MGSRAFKGLIRHRGPALLLLDLVAFQLAFHLTYVFRFQSGMFVEPVRPEYLPVSLSLLLFWVFVFSLRGMYASRLSTSRYEAISDVARSVFVGLIILFLISFDPSRPMSATRVVLLSYGLLVWVLSASARALLRTFLRSLLRRRIGLFNSIIVGSGERARRLYQSLSRNPIYGHEVVGIVGTTGDDPSEGALPLFDLSDGIGEVLRDPPGGDVKFVLIAFDQEDQGQVMRVIDQVHLHDVRVMIVPDFFQILAGMAKSRELYGVPLIEVFPDVLTPFTRMIKRAMDIVSAMLLLVIGLPLVLLFGLLILLESPGPAIYRQRRVGYRGREFTLYKLRSMRSDAEKATGAIWATPDDPRVTRIGRFIRATRIDELPQAINVLFGQMSLVGPRPERRVFVEEFARQIPFYTRRLNVKPGITGWAQVRRGYDASIEDVREKLQYDLFYVENLSIALDIKILLNTLWVIVTAKGH